MRSVAPALLALVTILGTSARVAADEVKINRREPIVERKTFDPKKPPAEMPKLDPKEAAVTQSFFGAESRVGGSVEQRKVGDEYHASVKVDTVEMTLTLRITIWLPKDAVPKLVNHEEGHRKISEHFYRDAEKIARKEAQGLLGRTIQGKGRDFEDAANNALQQAAQELGGRFLGQTDTPAGKAQDFYDEITAHGTNPVKEDKAIADAIRRATATDATSKDARN
jgi:hypothetical protein